MWSFILMFTGCMPNKETKMENHRCIPVDRTIELYVETYGSPEDQACLFISGAGANSSFWSDRLCHNLVSKGFFVIKYDHRDFGYSTKIDWTNNPYDFMRLTKDAVELLNALGVDRTHVVGHSMGGFIVQQLGIHYPERILSMTSISSSTGSPTVPNPPKRTWDIYLSNTPSGNFDNDLDGFMTVWDYLNGTAEFDRELAIDYTKNLYARQVIDEALGMSHVKAQATLTDRSDALGQVHIPTLVLHGEEDYAVDSFGAIQTAQTIPNSELKLIPKMGHIPFNRQLLHDFENTIIDFLVRNRRNTH